MLIRQSTLMRVRLLARLLLFVCLSCLLLNARVAVAQCTGCTISTLGNETILTFNGSGTFTVPPGVTTVRHLLVGGGGGGGGVDGGAYNAGGAGGGGGGGIRTGTVSITPFNNYPVTVGAGGAGGVGGVTMAGSGGNSIFATVTAIGGGGGATRLMSDTGLSGGSGGGGRINGLGGAGSAGQGNAGGRGGGSGAQSSGGGGGGAGGVGGNGIAGTVGGAGGVGASDNTSGTARTYSAGGAGGGYGANTPGTSATGIGNGGSGAWGNNNPLASNGGRGAAGLVIIRYTAPTQLTITTQPSTSAQSGVAFAQQPRIQLRDAAGNAVAQPNVPITVTIASGAGTLGGTTTATTDATGLASFTGLMISGTTGVRTLLFSSTGLTGVTSTAITITPGVATQLGIVTQPVAGISGAVLTTQPVLEIRDAWGNRTTSNAIVSVTIQSGIGGSLGGTQSVAAVLGTASFTNLSLSGIVGTNYVLRFSSTGLTAVDSANLTLVPVLPARLNAFDTTTLTGAINGTIGTKIAGSSFNIAVVSIATGGLAVMTNFVGTVQLDWMYAADNSGADPGTGCRSSWVNRGSAGTASFSLASLGRVTTSLLPPFSGREWRLRLTATVAGNTVVSCSSDAFSIIPAAFSTPQIGDADASTAGVARSLTNSSATGGVVHQAGRPFSLRAQAVDAANVQSAGYDGTPTLQIGACILPATGCTLGTLSVGALTIANGTISSDSLSYSEAGSFTLGLVDSNFAAIDAADTPLAQRTISSASATVGRFVPDHYRLAITTAGQLASNQNGCAAANRGFNFLGQSFGWATLPVVSVTAENATNQTTRNWAGSLQKLSAASGVQRTLNVTNASGQTLTPSWLAPTLADTGNGTARISFSSADRFLFARSTSTPVASFQPSIDVAVAIADTAESAVSGNPAINSLSPVNASNAAALGFDNGGYFHQGRLKLQNAFGDYRRTVSAVVELQVFTTVGWLRLDDDRGCLTLNASALGFGTGNGFLGSNVCAAPLAAAVTTQRGRALVTLGKSPSNTPGSAALYINLGPTLEGASCIGSPAVAGTPVTLNLPHLATTRVGGTGLFDSNPVARIVWGRAAREWIAQRETY